MHTDFSGRPCFLLSAISWGSFSWLPLFLFSLGVSKTGRFDKEHDGLVGLSTHGRRRADRVRVRPQVPLQVRVAALLEVGRATFGFTALLIISPPFEIDCHYQLLMYVPSKFSKSLFDKLTPL